MAKKCRSYLPRYPGDSIGPATRPGLTQVYIGGPFVVRSNPMGAVFDAVRRFCSPAAQEEVGDGSFVAEDSELSTPELSTFADAAGGAASWGYPADDAYFAPAGPPMSSPSGLGSCGAGTIWDAGLGACIPAPATASPSGSSPADARAALARAIAARDCEGVRQVLDLARMSRGAKSSAAYRSWQDVALRAKGWIERNGRLCR